MPKAIYLEVKYPENDERPDKIIGSWPRGNSITMRQAADIGHHVLLSMQEAEVVTVRFGELEEQVSVKTENDNGEEDKDKKPASPLAGLGKQD